jgi:protein-disulfide isomerase
MTFASTARARRLAGVTSVTWLVAALAVGGCRSEASRAARPASESPAGGTPVAEAATVTDSSKTAGRVPRQVDSAAARADRARIRGDSTATVWMVMISDFQCPYCKEWHDSTFAIVDRDYVRTGKVRMAYVNLPLPMHKQAFPAAEAAMCAAVQGRFWPMHDALFATQQRWETLTDATPVFDSLATSIGADPARMRTCTATHAMRALVQADMDRSVAAGVQSTPTFLIGNQTVRGAAPTADFRRALDAALSAAGQSR